MICPRCKKRINSGPNRKKAFKSRNKKVWIHKRCPTDKPDKSKELSANT